MNEQLLLVEDDDAIASALRMHLEEAGFRLHREADGRLAMATIARQRFDLVLLDVMLPGADGWEVCRHLRAHHADVPVIMLSARSSEAHRVLGLELGADDYLAKPFDVTELVARLRALIRRSQGEEEWHCGNLRLDRASELFYNGLRPLELSPREAALLKALIMRRGQAVSKDSLHQAVFGSGATEAADAVEVLVHRLRKRIAGCAVELMTLRGVGYLLIDEAVVAKAL